MRKQMEIINACISRQSELYGQWARRHGMSRSTLMILYALDREHARTQQEIADWWMLPKQTVHTVVKELERQGLVRLGAGRDQKEKVLVLTPEGQGFVKERMEPLYQAEERALTAMGPALIQAYVQGTQAFTGALAEEVQRG